MVGPRPNVGTQNAQAVMMIQPQSKCRRGFTLIELLLVLVIIGIITAVAVPQFVQSMRGNRRRSAARTVIAAGRYARSMAVLHQRPMAITFDLESASLVVALAQAGQMPGDADDEDGDDTELSPGLPGEAALGDQPDRDTGPVAGAVTERLERRLDQVAIVSVSVDGEHAVSEGKGRVVYESNGRCTPYQVTLVDAEEETVVIKVDALASAMTTTE